VWSPSFLHSPLQMAFEMGILMMLQRQLMANTFTNRLLLKTGLIIKVPTVLVKVNHLVLF